MNIASKTLPNVFAGADPGRAVHEAEGGGFDLRQQVRVLWRRRGLIASCVVVATAFAILYVTQVAPRYSASTTLLVQGSQPKVVDLEEVVAGVSSDTTSLNNEIEVLRSRHLAARVVERLGLLADPEYNPTLPQPRAGLSAAFAELCPDGLAECLLQSTGIAPLLGLEARPPEPLPDPDRTLILTSLNVARAITVEMVGRSQIIRLTATSLDPDKSRLLADAYADLYLTEQLEAKYEGVRRATHWLQDRLGELKERVETSERAVEAYRSDAGLISSGGSTVTSQQLTELTTQHTLAKAKRSESEARLRQLQDLIRTGNTEVAPEVLTSTTIQNLKQREGQVLSRLSELGTQYGERHPSIIKLRAELKEIRDGIDLEVRRIVKSIENDVVVMRTREQTLAGSLRDLQNNAARQNTSEIQLRQLEREAEANRTMYDTFLNRFKETSAQVDLQAADARVLSTAVTPGESSWPPRRLIVISAFVASLILGAGLAFALESFDRGFRSTEQIEGELGVAPLGIVPIHRGSRVSLQRSGRFARNLLSLRRKAIWEALWHIRAGVQISNIDTPPRVILVTSAVSSEGKSFVASSISLMEANSGRRTLLIDCDMRRPTVHQLMGVENRDGLVELLSGSTDEATAIRTQEDTGLAYMVAGKMRGSPQDFLGSRAMRALLDRLRQSYDVIYLDVPPIMPVSDALVLAPLADTALFVVRWETTKRDLVRVALKRLATAGTHVAGVALNQVDVRRHARYDYADSGIYYGKGYGRYYTS